MKIKINKETCEYYGNLSSEKDYSVLMIVKSNNTNKYIVINEYNFESWVAESEIVIKDDDRQNIGVRSDIIFNDGDSLIVYYYKKINKDYFVNLTNGNTTITKELLGFSKYVDRYHLQKHIVRFINKPDMELLSKISKDIKAYDDMKEIFKITLQLFEYTKEEEYKDNLDLFRDEFKSILTEVEQFIEDNYSEFISK